MSDKNFIKFLGTAGARFVMIKQLRSSAGLWIKYKGTDLIVDPGPGSIVRCNTVRPKVNFDRVEGILLTHKHLDHSGDINVMIEAMTEGGFKRRGKVFLPSDALGEDGVVFSYLKNFPEEIIIWEENKRYSLGDIDFICSLKNKHPVETYGIKFILEDKVFALVSDTEYFDKIVEVYKKVDYLILNVVFYESHPNCQHLSLSEALNLVRDIEPKYAIFTHFGMSMLRQNLYKLQEKIQKESFPNVIFAYDGLSIEIN